MNAALADLTVLAALPSGKLVSVKLVFPESEEFRHVEQDLLGIALLSRMIPVANHLNKRTVATVVRNADVFRRLAKECPKLLSLMLAFYSSCRYDDPDRARDPVFGLKMWMHQRGLSEATWRYFVRHGSRLFRVPWALSGGVGVFDAALTYLHLLQSVGLPPPPPPTLIQSLICVYGRHAGRFVLSDKDLSREINPQVLRAGFIEADRHRKAGTLAGFIDEFLGVCCWAEKPMFPDRNQTKAGWRWFVRQWQRAEHSRERLAILGCKSWTCRVSSFEYGGVGVVPIQSTEDLLAESVALRNCLTRYAADCAAGDTEIYSCREPTTGKRIGCIGVRFRDHKAEVFDVKGYANLPPGNAVEQVVGQLLSRFPTELMSFEDRETVLPVVAKNDTEPR